MRKRKTAVLKASQKLIAFVQVILVEKAGKIAKKQNIDYAGVQGIILLHGISILFLAVEKEYSKVHFGDGIILKFKETIILKYMKLFYQQNEITQNKVEQFAKNIYDLLLLLDCKADTDGEKIVSRIRDSIYGLTGLKRDTMMDICVKELYDSVAEYLNNINIAA